MILITCLKFPTYRGLFFQVRQVQIYIMVVYIEFFPYLARTWPVPIGTAGCRQHIPLPLVLYLAVGQKNPRMAVLAMCPVPPRLVDCRCPQAAP